mgnify:CR=1 FL=1
MTKPNYTFEQAWDDGDIVIILLAIISLIITEIGSCLAPSNQQQQYVSGSLSTTHSKSVLTKNQPPFVSTNAALHTEDQKKVVGITNEVGPSKRSVSSARSRQSAKPSSSKRKPKSNLVIAETISDGTPGVLTLTPSMPKHTQQNVRTTAEQC